MSLLALLFLVLGLGLIAWISARMRAARFPRGTIAERPHSLPAYHGWYVGLWVAIPALLFLGVWAAVSPGLISQAVLATPGAADLPVFGMERAAVLSEARAIATGDAHGGFYPQAVALAPAYKTAILHYGLIGAAVTLILAFACGAYAFTRIRPDFRARTRVERLVMGALLVASLIAILTTIGIFASLVFESARFFKMVSPLEFLFGTHWSPQTAMRPDQVGSSGAFGAVALFWGTIFIGAIIAMIVAIPLGLMSAVYLTQYARPATRRWVKPILEILAGVPTVVYGYFAALTVAPALRNFAVSIGISEASSESALAAGLVMAS